MPYYRKKPVVIKAVQWTGENDEEVTALFESVPDDMKRGLQIGGYCVYITTLEGEMRADAGDYIIKGVKGELYPCKPDIFEQTYELVPEFQKLGPADEI